MRVPIAHTLPKEEVRRRLRERSHEIANFIPGGMADVTTGWTFPSAPWVRGSTGGS